MYSSIDKNELLRTILIRLAKGGSGKALFSAPATNMVVASPKQRKEA